MKKIKMGFSPCPNDTFIMAGIGTRNIHTQADFEIYIEDVETLNQWAMDSRLNVTKMSFFAFGNLLSEYALLYTGCALGQGAGPVLVARPGVSLKEIENEIIASPGRWTTAGALMSLYLGYVPEFKYMPYSEIMDAVLRGDVKFGLVIHEGRFTYRQYGLELIIDLGKWWKEKTGLSIPLGGFFIHRSMERDIAIRVDSVLRSSLNWSYENREEAMKYVMGYAQELDHDVVKQHIEFFVNNETLKITDKGIQAVERFLELSMERGLIPNTAHSVFAY